MWGVVQMLLAIVGTIVIVSVFFLMCASIAKGLAFKSPTRDGDSFGNRLAGHGPNDEIAEPRMRDRITQVRERARRFSRS